MSSVLVRPGQGLGMTELQRPTSYCNKCKKCDIATKPWFSRSSAGRDSIHRMVTFHMGGYWSDKSGQRFYSRKILLGILETVQIL